MRVLLFTAAALLFMTAGLFAGQPMPVSVTPASQTFNTTATTTYTFVASDSDGAGDLLGIDALMGNNYECWLFYNQSTHQISVWNNDNGNNSGVWTTEAAGQPGATLNGNACSIDPSTASATASGNNLNVSVQITLGGLSGTHYIYLSASNVAGTASPYVQLGSWTVQTGSTNYFQITVSPNEGFIRAGGTTTATVTIADQPGFNGTVNLSLGAFPNGSNLTGSFNPTSITGNGTSTLTIISTAESPTSWDPVTVFGTTPDGSIQQSVTFNTFIDTAPPTLSMTLPSPNAGSGGVFRAVATDGATAETIQGINLLINSTLDGEHACWMWYDAKTGYLWLASDDGSSWSGIIANGPAPVSNSQCSAGGPGTTISNQRVNGDNLVIGIPIQFNSGFAGAKNVYERSVDFAGFDTGYQQEGTYTVQ
jgi:hypothetical protein